MTNPDTGAVNPIFNGYNYVKANPSHVNGFKILNDETEMMKLILPTIKNQGLQRYEDGQSDAKKK